MLLAVAWRLHLYDFLAVLRRTCVPYSWKFCKSQSNRLELADFRKLNRQTLKSDKRRTQVFNLEQQNHVYNILYWGNIKEELITGFGKDKFLHLRLLCETLTTKLTKYLQAELFYCLVFLISFLFQSLGR